jgi:hypothetical protein
MAEFNPDEYLGIAQGFDPDAYLGVKKTAPLAPVGERLQRQLGLTGRYLTEAADVLASPVRGALNLVLPESLQAKPLAETLNLPKPSTGLERMVAGPSRALASTLGTAGLGTLARPTSQLGQTIQQAFAASSGGRCRGEFRRVFVCGALCREDTDFRIRGQSADRPVS